MANQRQPPVPEMRDAGWSPNLIDWLVQLADTLSHALERLFVFNSGGRVLVSNATTKGAEESSITTTKLGYLNGVTSPLQEQLDGKVTQIDIADLAGGASLSDTVSKVNDILAALRPPP